jgi:hypothetical protein
VICRRDLNHSTLSRDETILYFDNGKSLHTMPMKEPHV